MNVLRRLPLFFWMCRFALGEDICFEVVKSCNGCYLNTECNNDKAILKMNSCGERIGDTLTLSAQSNQTFSEITLIDNLRCNYKRLEISMLNVSTSKLSLCNGSFENISIYTRPVSLRYLDITANKLQCLDDNIFSEYKYLLDLKLNKNQIEVIKEDAFNGLINLDSLDLSENKISDIKYAFVPLKNLQHLNLSWNQLNHLHESYLQNGMLQHLDVSHNKIKIVSAGALQFLPNLARLLIADNPLLGSDQLESQLLVATGQRLQQIDASKTGLSKVPEAFTHSIRFLSLSGNSIQSIQSGDLDTYPLLQSLDVVDNKIQKVQDDALGRLEMLLFLNFNKNQLQWVPKMLPHELKYLSLNHNMIANLTTADFKNLSNLRILLLYNNKITSIQEKVFEDLITLEVLDLSNNPIKTLSTSSLAGPIALRDLRLCYLNVTLPVGDGTFPIPLPESLQMLHLQSSPSLAKHLLSDSAVLAALSHLQYLDLRMNNLSHVRNDILFYLVQLSTLRLHGNGFNCSGEEWLTKLIVWNNSLVKKESCYYSTEKDKKEEMNCTFSESFSINDKLPPVNLYSTEMINKLLSYYGFLNNKNISGNEKGIQGTNITISKDNCKENDCTNHIQKNKDHTFVDTNQIKAFNYNGKTKQGKKKIFNRYTNTDTRKKMLGESDTINGYNGITFGKNTQETSFGTDHYVKHENKSYIYLKKQKKKSGKMINKDRKLAQGAKEEIFEKIQPYKETFGNQTVNMSFTSESNLENTANVYKSTTVSDKSEYSPFQSTVSSYKSYIGTLAVLTLMVCCLVLWASLRLRYRKRRAGSIPENDREDHIEVSNISGGVLW